MKEKLEQLKNILGEVDDLNQAQAVISWDMQTYMPPGGAEAHGHQLATLARLAHNRFTSEETGRLLEDMSAVVEQLPPDSDEASLIHVTKRHYDKQTRVPADLVAENAELTAIGQDVWQRARQENDFAAFEPYLDKIFDLRRRYAALFSPFDHIYDPLLDDFEPGLKTAAVQNIFDILRPAQVRLIRAIRERQQVEDGFLHQFFPEQEQWDFGVEVIKKFGYDWKRGRQDRSAHPFTTSFGPNDVRITTRILPENGVSALFGTMHECGHALYEQGINQAYQRTPLCNAASMALHESQSRLWENLVGRSLPFWTYYYPRFQQIFSTQLGNVNLAAFYRGINKVEPSLVRVEADEATYNLHIMLRLQLEIEVMEEKLRIHDLPEVWNSRMAEDLGVTPPNAALGVLQDIHWSGGLIGYFPTYALGNLISVQLWEKIGADLPDLEAQIARGEFSALLEWLRQHIHIYGAKYEPGELVLRVTGEKINPYPYLRYLENKYREIYRF